MFFSHLSIQFNPLSCFPQGGNAICATPSPMGEGWEGGNPLNILMLSNTGFEDKKKVD
jgi:hypothetical protein